MKYYFKRKIGKSIETFVSEGENLFDLVYESKKLSFDAIHKCGLCGNENLKLDAHVTDKDSHEYVYVKCLNPNCRASLNFGRKKKDPNVFYPRTVEDANGNKVFDWKPFITNE